MVSREVDEFFRQVDLELSAAQVEENAIVVNPAA